MPLKSFFSSALYTIHSLVFDVCDIENGGCEHNCTNIGSSYYCTCNSGYELHTDRITCHGELFQHNVYMQVCFSCMKVSLAENHVYVCVCMCIVFCRCAHC